MSCGQGTLWSPLVLMTEQDSVVFRALLHTGQRSGSPAALARNKGFADGG